MSDVALRLELSEVKAKLETERRHRSIEVGDLTDSIESLRTELARRDEVEKELREKLEQTESMATEDVAYQNTHILQKDQLIASLRSRIGELEAKYGVQEQLDHIFGQLPSDEDT